MRILVACGGTSGHINPALAIAGELKNQFPEAEFLFVGTKNHLEAELVPRAGFKMEYIEVSGFIRKKNFDAIMYNLSSVRKYLAAKSKVRKIIKEFRPDVALGTGGYVSAPVISTASDMGIKTVIHEQNAFPGIATQMLARHTDKLLLGFELAKKLKDIDDSKIRIVGNPVRREFLSVTKEEARKALGLNDSDTVVLSYGGSMGARKLNDAFIEMAELSAKDNVITHFHGATSEYEKVTKALAHMSDNPKIKVFEYIYNIPEIMAAADLVVCRAGASTLSELGAVGRAGILIPSPNVTENHQFFNAKTFSDKGAAVILEEKYLSGAILYENICNIVFNKKRLSEMEKASASTYNRDCAEDICEEILKMI